MEAGGCGRRRRSTNQERISAELRRSAMDSGTRIVTVVISTSGKLYFRDPPAATIRIEPRRALP